MNPHTYAADAHRCTAKDAHTWGIVVHKHVNTAPPPPHIHTHTHTSGTVTEAGGHFLSCCNQHFTGLGSDPVMIMEG